MFDKSNAPKIAGTLAFLLGIVKLVAGILSGSVAVLSSAIDSMLDCLISIFNYFALKKSTSSANRRFNYGFGKIEALMATLEGLFIIVIGVFILYTSVKKTLEPDGAFDFGVAFWVMIFSFLATGGLIAYLSKVAKATGSLIVKADMLHYKSDFFTNLGIIVTLVVVKLTGLVLIDAVVGFLIGGYIIFSAIALVKEGVLILLDSALPEEMITAIEAFVRDQPDVKSYHDLRTRKSGETCFLSAHLVFSPTITLEKAHAVGDKIEAFAREKFAAFTWVIDLHFDPKDDSAGE